MKRWIHASNDVGMKAAESIQNFIDEYGFSNFDVYDRTNEWLAIDVEGEDEDTILSLLNRLHAWDLDASISDHYIEIYIGDDDRFQ